jgi:hypothetical protein
MERSIIRLEQVEERIWEFEDKVEELLHSYSNEENKICNHDQNI